MIKKIFSSILILIILSSISWAFNPEEKLNNKPIRKNSERKKNQSEKNRQKQLAKLSTIQKHKGEKKDLVNGNFDKDLAKLMKKFNQY